MVQSKNRAAEWDKAFRARIAKTTMGMAPAAYATAWADWALHLAFSPAAMLEVQKDAWRRTVDTWQFAARAALGRPTSPSERLPDADKRFEGEAWHRFPFNVLARAYQHSAAITRDAVRSVDGVGDYHADLVEFATKQSLDAWSPANFPLTNPEIVEATQRERGQNLVRGFQYLLEDTKRALQGGAPAGSEAFEVGKTVAVTPGQVVFRNELVEVIQYAPTTKDVYAEPILFVPAWIMKYYILDLSPKNSLYKYLVDQGHTVFTISWRNPTAEHREWDMADYLKLGFFDVIDAISAIVPDRKIQVTGYCIGGTLASIGTAALAREGDTRIGSLTLFAAQTDFSEPGELSLFISPSQLKMLEASMHDAGVLESKQMAGAFVMLRAQDLLYQPAVNTYLKGKRDPMIDLMAWNADGTRMPWKMHTEYLYRLYLDNELATNRFPVNGRPVRLSDIKVPLFVVGTEADHVAPWKSVYKIDNFVRSDDVTFLLTSGGHNAGIVSGPVHPKRHFRMRTRRLADPHLPPQEWYAETEETRGSWWPAWASWLSTHASGRGAWPKMGMPGSPTLGPAPGTYVLEK